MHSALIPPNFSFSNFILPCSPYSILPHLHSSFPMYIILSSPRIHILPCLNISFPIHTYSVLHSLYSHISVLHSPYSHVSILSYSIPHTSFPHILYCCDSHTSVLQELGFTKVGHMTKLRTGIQTLNPTVHSGQGATKRARQFRDTR